MRGVTNHCIPVRAFVGCSIALLCVLATAMPAIAADADSVVAVVNGQELRRLHFDRVMDEILPMASFHGGVTEEVKARNRQQALERLIEDELLYQEAVRLGARPDSKNVDAELKESIERVGGKERFEEALQHYGVDLKEFRRTLGKPEVVKGFLRSKVDGQATVQDQEIRDYYEKNRESHFMVEKRRLKHIVLKTDPGDASSWDVTREKAADILARIRKGADFGDMARKFSQGPRREAGGDTGYIARAQLLPELASVGWSMKPGDVSDIITTIYGFHIIKLEEVPPAEAVPFEEASSQIRLMLLTSRKQELKGKLLDELRRKASVKVLNE